MQKARDYATMTETQRLEMNKLLAGLEMGPNGAERVLAEGQVNRFLEALYDHMEADHVTQADLARRMDVQANQIRRWLSTESSLKASTMFLLARMMGYEIAQEWRPIGHTYGSVDKFTVASQRSIAVCESGLQEAA
jgi:plasmid maintenance system antidote protein VapI